MSMKNSGLILVIIIFNLFSFQQFDSAKGTEGLLIMSVWGLGYIIGIGLFMWFYYKFRMDHIRNKKNR